jgi:hypothetical protein
MKTAALLFAAALAMGTVAEAQTPPQTQSAPAPAGGLAIADIAAWLSSQGLQPGELQRGEPLHLRVRDGQLTWILAFYACEADVCGDMQFSAGFSNDGVTLAMVNDWNRERRFLKAYHEPPAAGAAAGAAVVQHDVIFSEGRGVEQLTDALAVWRTTLADFAVHVGYFVPAPAPGAP